MQLRDHNRRGGTSVQARCDYCATTVTVGADGLCDLGHQVTSAPPVPASDLPEAVAEPTVPEQAVAGAAAPETAAPRPTAPEPTATEPRSAAPEPEPAPAFPPPPGSALHAAPLPQRGSQGDQGLDDLLEFQSTDSRRG